MQSKVRDGAWPRVVKQTQQAGRTDFKILASIPLHAKSFFYVVIPCFMSAVKGCFKKGFPPLIDKPSGAQAKPPAFFSLI